MWRASFADLDRAKSHAQELVKGEGKEFVIYNFNRCREVARISPAKSEALPPGTAQNRRELNDTRPTKG